MRVRVRVRVRARVRACVRARSCLSLYACEPYLHKRLPSVYNARELVEYAVYSRERVERGIPKGVVYG